MASLAELLLGKESPVTQFTQRNSGLLTGLGTSLLSDGMNFQPAQVGATLDRQAAAQRDADAKLAASTNATKQWLAQKYPDLAQAVDAGLPVSEAWQQAFARQNAKTAPVDPTKTPDGRAQLGQQYGLTGDDLTTFVLTGNLPSGRGAAGEVSLQPTYLRNTQTGEITMGQANKAGGVQLSDVPAGYEVVNPFELAGGKAGAVADEKTSATARAALPSAELNYEIAIRAADSLLSDQTGMEEQFGNILGVPQQMTGAFPGTPKANFRNQLDQLTGQAFLNIRQALKGAGAVTDYEGQRGEVALSRAQAAAEKGDKKAFQQAVIEFKDSITKGLDLLRQQAQGGYSAGTPAVGGGGGGGGDDIDAILKGLGI